LRAGPKFILIDPFGEEFGDLSNPEVLIILDYVTNCLVTFAPLLEHSRKHWDGAVDIVIKTHFQFFRMKPVRTERHRTVLLPRGGSPVGDCNWSYASTNLFLSDIEKVVNS
jgi:hypothetical protein